MTRFIARKLGVTVIVLFNVSVIGFFMLRLTGDLTRRIVGPEATAEEVELVRRAYGLDKPILSQYFDWLGGVLQGDFGQSFFYKTDVTALLVERLPTTMSLGALGLAFAVIVGIPLGVTAALFPRSLLDRAVLTIAVLGQAMPSFWIALLLLLLFGVKLGWLPISGSETWQHFVLPSFVLGIYATPGIARLTRSGMIDVLQADYIRTAWAKGMNSATVIFKHALRNAAIPVVSVAAVQLGFLMGGSVVIESVFSIHGVGFLAWESISRSDFPVVQAIVLVLALMYVVLVFLADVLNAVLDPRLREG